MLPLRTLSWPSVTVSGKNYLEYCLEDCDFSGEPTISSRFHKPQEIKTEVVAKNGEEAKEPVKKGPQPTDWRWGPAQYWYDMLELPEDCPDYDYGLRVVGKEEQEQMDKAVAGIPAGESLL